MNKKINVKIVTTEPPSEYEPWKKIITEELVDIDPDDAYRYVKDEVMDVPDRKWTSLDEYWNECFADFSKNDENKKIVKSMFDFYNGRYEFWVEEKTGDYLRKWLDDNKSVMFTISYDNFVIDFMRQID